MDSLKNIVRAYERWVAANPETVCDVETTTKWVSYFIAGRITNSNVVSELIYSLSNLLVLYNDRIIDRSRGAQQAAVAGVGAGAGSEGLCYRLKVMLTTLEYCEVFVEISAKRVFGARGRWLFIAILQTFKAAGRYFILKHSTAHIITSPALPSLNRRAMIRQQKANGGGGGSGKGIHRAEQRATVMPDEHSFTFQLRRSGRVVRKVEGAPPLQYRSFKLTEELEAENQKAAPQVLLRAEYLYIAKPLIHLAAMGVFGSKRWGQYAVALAVDLVSINMYHRNRHLMNKEQKLEMTRRCLNLVLYMARSPFYERYTRSRLDRMLGYVADNIPIAKMIAGPLREYIPHWQSNYFYLWST